MLVCYNFLIGYLSSINKYNLSSISDRIHEKMKKITIIFVIVFYIRYIKCLLSISCESSRTMDQDI